jgi:xyloglucan-specific exo-beta-1,4-glucanase
VFNSSQKGLAFLRTDIGGAYKLNSDDSWTPLVDFANDTTWWVIVSSTCGIVCSECRLRHDWGTDAIATDPVNPNNLSVFPEFSR